MARKKNRSQRIVRMESLKQLNLDAAGMDIHADEIRVCVPEDRDEQSVCQFGACTCDLHALADWLAHCGVRTVAMEATGGYWVHLRDTRRTAIRSLRRKAAKLGLSLVAPNEVAVT